MQIILWKKIFMIFFVFYEIRGLDAAIKGFSKSCDEFRAKGFSRDGVYRIYVNGIYVKVYCEFEKGSPDLNWLVFQKRTSNEVDFYKPWEYYKKGFGDLEENFWLGLDHLHRITKDSDYVLRIEMKNFDGELGFAEYNSFKVGDEKSNYVASVGSYVGGNAGDSFSYHDNSSFSTFDRDNDEWSGNCAVVRHCGWWFRRCTYANLNGKWFDRSRESFAGMFWFQWKNNAISLMTVKMKIRPKKEEAKEEKEAKEEEIF